MKIVDYLMFDVPIFVIGKIQMAGGWATSHAEILVGLAVGLYLFCKFTDFNIITIRKSR